jgi:hypothetical protein
VAGANVTSPTGAGQVTQARFWCTGIHRHESEGVRERRSLVLGAESVGGLLSGLVLRYPGGLLVSGSDWFSHTDFV